MSVDIDPDMKHFLETATEPLDSELEAWVDEGTFGPMLRHPLIYAVPLLHHGLANKAFRVKKESLAEAIASRNWHRYVFTHERPYRFHAMTVALREMPVDEEAWKLVREVWIDSENIWQNYSEWEDLFAEMPGAHSMMDDKERETLDALPGVVNIYRGCVRDENEDGLSWTLDKSKAEWFANRFAHKGEGIVIEATVPRPMIFALLLSRGEEEVIASPDDIHIRCIHESA